MKPVEFVLWLNGAAELVGDQPPSPEQWATMREKLGEAVGGLVAARLLERAEETLRADERRKEEEANKAETMNQMLESIRAQRSVWAGADLAGYQAKIDMYKHQVDLEAQKMLGLARVMSADTLPEVLKPPELLKPEPPKLPGFIDCIISKAST